MAKKLKEGFHVGGGEKWSYALYFFGQNIFYALVALNVHTMFSDVGITAATVAIILFVTRLWDAINDPIMGVIIDKVKFKKGRFLPWLRISLPIIAVTSVIMFALPTGAPLTVKVIWAIIAYMAWDAAYTLCDVPIYVLPSSMTDNIKERSGILSLGRYIGVVGIMLGMTLLPMIQGRVGWFVTGIILTIVATGTMVPLLFKAKERHIVRPEETITMRQMVRFVTGNKYLLIFYCAMFLSLVTNFSQTLMMFFARHNLGDQDFAGLMGLITMVPLVIVGGFIPVIIKKIDKYYIFLFGLIATALLGIIRYFVGYESLPVFIALVAIHGLILGSNGILIFMFTPDCLEYGTYKTGERSEGVAVSLQTFFNKLTGSLSGPIAMLIVGAFGFVAGEGAAQPESALSGIWLSMTVLPSIGAALAVIMLLFYKLRNSEIQTMAEYSNGEISKEDAEALLAEKYGPAGELTKMTITTDE